MLGPKNETEELLLSKTLNCETLKKQTHKKPQETLEFRLKHPREIFSFKPFNDLGLDSKWMVGLTS